LVLKGTLVILATVLVFGSTFAMFAVLFRGIALDTATTAIAAILGVLTASGFLGTTSLALQGLFLGSDLPFLRSLPLPLRSIYLLKFSATVIGTGAMLPLWLGVSSGVAFALGGSWLSALTIIAVLTAFIVSATSCSVIIVTLIGRWLPARHARVTLAGVSLCLVFAIAATTRFLAPQPVSISTPIAAGMFINPIARAGARLNDSPFAWAADAIVASATGDLPRLLRATALVVGGTGAVAMLAFLVFAAYFVVGADRYRLAGGPPARRTHSSPLVRLTRPLDNSLAALVWKEWLVAGRDLRRLSGAIWPLGLVVFYAISLARRGSPEAPMAAPFGFWLEAGPVFLLPWGMSLGTTFYAFGSERRNLHLLRILPVTAHRLLLGKILAALAPILVLSQGAVAVVAVAKAASLLEWLSLAALVAWTALGYVTIDTAAAAVAPNFDTDQLQRATGLPGRLFGLAFGGLFTLASAGAVAMLVILKAGPVAGDLPTFVRTSPFSWPIVLLLTALAATTVFICFKIGQHRVARLLQPAPPR